MSATTNTSTNSSLITNTKKIYLPKKPQNIEITNITFNSVNITWISNEYMFKFQLFNDNNTIIYNNTINRYFININNLNMTALYYFRVLSINNYGKSEYTKKYNFTTNTILLFHHNYSNSNKKNIKPILLIWFICLILLLLVFLIFKFVKRNRKKVKIGNSEIINKHNNPLYESNISIDSVDSVNYKERDNSLHNNPIYGSCDTTNNSPPKHTVQLHDNPIYLPSNPPPIKMVPKNMLK